MMKTSFSQWRERMGITQEDAAARLGVTKSQIANWESGRDRASGRPSRPGLAVRKVMSLLIRGDDVQEWPQ